MSFALMVIGALVAVLGMAAIGFGIPINEFSLGNTLIISGTTAVAGGLILVALGAALRQLTRIAEALTRQMPQMPRPQRAGEPAEAAATRPVPPPAPPPRVPFPPKPPSRDSREAAADMRLPEPPRPLGAPPMVAEDRTRPRFPPPPLNEDVAELDEPVPPSPQAAPPVFPPPPTAAPAASAPSREPLMPSARAEARSDEARAVGSAAVDVTRGPRLDPPWKPTLPAEREAAAGGPERTRGLFDSLWPVDRGRKDAEPRKADLGRADLAGPFPPRERREEEKATDLGMAAVGEALAKGLEPEPAAPEPAEARSEEPTVHSEPAAAPPVEEPEATEPPRSAEPAPAAPAAPVVPAAGPVDRSVTILKSGVVDGMAYTLYSDGSIEAELPEGTIRFTSIEDLRRHLDTHS